MAKVAIIDDEAGQLVMLQKVLSLLASDFEVLSFGHPKDLIDYASKEKLDVLLCDIRMDEMDGLTLCKTISEVQPETILSVISAYSDFSYAQSAIDLGVKAYLTKPVSRTKLQEWIEKIRLLLNERHQHEATENKLETWLQFDKEQAWPFTNDCLPGKPAFFCAFDSRMEEKIKQALLKGSGLNETVFFATHPQKSTIELLVSFSQHENFFSNLDQILHDFHHSGSLGGWIAALRIESESPIAWRTALDDLDALGDIAFSLHEKCMTPERRWQTREIPDQVLLDFEKSILLEAGNGDRSNLLAVTERFEELIRHNHWYSKPYVLKEIIRHIIVSMLRKTGKMISPSINERINTAETLRELTSLILLLNEEGQAKAAENKTIKSENPQQMPEIITYVNEHFRENLSLESVASRFAITPGYLSTVFKQTAGVGFRQFLIDRRMEEARKLLMTTNLKVYEIATRVGYFDVTSFVKAFEKNSGLPPKQWKRKNA